MSYDIYFTLRSSKKSYYYIDTLFFGKKKVYDFKNLSKSYKEVKLIYDTFDECLEVANQLDLSEFVIRREIETGGGLMTKDYKYKRNRLRLR